MSELKTTRCVRCASEFSEAEIASAKACPSCASTAVPCAIAEDVDVRINWHELRILVMWAEHYEGSIVRADPDGNGSAKGCIKAIADRLLRYRPASAGPLRFADEFSELQDHFPTAELLDGQGNLIVGKRTVN